MCKLLDKTTHSERLITWVGLGWFVALDSSAKVTFIPVLHEKGQQLEAMRTSSVLAAVLFLTWFIRRAAWQARLLGKFPPRVPGSQYWDPS